MVEKRSDQFRQSLENIILRSTTKEGKIFDLFIQCLILVSLITFTMETVKGQSVQYYRILRVVEYFTIFVFTIEYLLRVILVRRKWQFIFSFMGIIDLMAILPFFLATGLDLRSLRILRIMRVFKMLRYNETLLRMRKTLQIARKELTIFFTFACILIYLSAVGIYSVEHKAQPEHFTSMLDALWWAVATLTTVGYGDIFPITPVGRLLTFFILMIGLGIVAVPSGIIASAFTKAGEKS